MSLSKQRLQRLLGQRERLEQAQEAAFAGAVRAESARVRAVEAAVEHRRAVVDHAPASPADPVARATARAHVVSTDRAIEARRAAQRHAAADAARERDELLARRRERLAFQTLLARRDREARERQARRERALLDEAAINGWLSEQRPPDHICQEYRP